MSTTIPIQQISNIDDCVKDKWFLLHTIINNKNRKYDDNLNAMYDRLYWYILFYGKTLYCYLMTDRYYFKSKLSKIFKNYHSCICMECSPRNWNDYMQNSDKFNLIEEGKRICTCEDIKKIFDIFTNNNFKINSICEVIIGK